MPRRRFGGVTLALAALMEWAALMPLTLMMTGMAAAPAPPAWWLPAVLATGLLLTRQLQVWVERRRTSHRNAARVLGGGGVVAAVVGAALSPAHPFLAVVLAAAAWWRGTAVAGYGQDHRRLSETAVRLGALLVAPVALQLLANVPGWSAAAAPYYLVFASAGLAAMAAARLQALWPQDPGPEHGGARSGLTAATAGMALVLIPALLVWVIAQTKGAVLVAIVHTLGRWVLAAVYWVILAFVWTIGRLIFAAWQLVARLLARTEPPPMQPAAEPFPRDWLLERALDIPEAWIRAMGVAAFLLVLALAGLIVYRSFGRLFQAGQDGDVPEERESIFSWRKLRRRARRAPRPSPVGSDLGADLLSQLRRIYRSLQAAGARAGRPRRACETPDEYQPRLVDAGLDTATVAQISHLYAAARYGDLLPEPAALAAARDASSHLVAPPSALSRFTWWRRRS